MKTIEDAWLELSNKLEGIVSPKMIDLFIKNSFYSGAVAAHCFILEAFKEDNQEKFNALGAELDNFRKKVEAEAQKAKATMN